MAENHRNLSNGAVPAESHRSIPGSPAVTHDVPPTYQQNTSGFHYEMPRALENGLMREACMGHNNETRARANTGHGASPAQSHTDGSGRSPCRDPPPGVARNTEMLHTESRNEARHESHYRESFTFSRGYTRVQNEYGARRVDWYSEMRWTERRSAPAPGAAEFAGSGGGAQGNPGA